MVDPAADARAEVQVRAGHGVVGHRYAGEPLRHPRSTPRRDTPPGGTVGAR